MADKTAKIQHESVENKNSDTILSIQIVLAPSLHVLHLRCADVGILTF